jgi:hypothetical protein
VIEIADSPDDNPANKGQDLYGTPPMHQLFDAHLAPAQHTRQMIAVLERFGIACRTDGSPPKISPAYRFQKEFGNKGMCELEQITTKASWSHNQGSNSYFTRDARVPESLCKMISHSSFNLRRSEPRFI